MTEDNIKPQHDFDEQKRIRWEITQKGREALKSGARLEGYNNGYEDCWRDLKGWETLGR